ncbi:MAG: type II CAAX endopeptidase family protein [Alistipes sp.]|nr:type II CAAX endopeptidase family protein [Alistipes sp.]
MDPTQKKRKAFPSASDLLSVFGVYFAATILFNLLGGLLSKVGMESLGLRTFSVYVLAFLTTIGYGVLLWRLRTGSSQRILHLGLKKCSPSLLLWGILTVLATTLTLEPLLDLLPPRWIEWLSSQMQLGGWMMVTTVVAAPILEEILFRGIIQGSLTRRYGAWRGILIASALFGIIHGIPQQILNAFFIGVILGFIYERTGALLPVILIHGFNNALSYSMWLLSNEKIVWTRDMIDNDTLYAIIYGVAALLFLLGWGVMIRSWRRTPVPSPQPTDTASAIPVQKTQDSPSNS